MRIGGDGSVTPIDSKLRGRLAEMPGEYRVHEGPVGTLLLQRLGVDTKPRGRLLMVGEIITRMTVVEVLNIITSANWRGELHLFTPLGKRLLTIDQGALKNADSDHESERLGEVLVRNGVLSRESLLPLLKKRKPDQRFGQLLLEEGRLAPEALFMQLQKQTEQIFYASLLEERGTYWFIAPSEDAPAPSTTVHLPVQALLMEGVQRIDEMALFRERIPHNRFFPAATGKPPPKTKGDVPEAYMLELLALCDGTRSIDDLARESALGEYSVLKAVYSLARTGTLAIRRGPTLDEKAARKLVRQFNELIRDVFVVVATYGSMETASKALSNWLELSPHAAVLGTQVDFDGTLNADLIATLLQAASLDDPMGQLHQSLHELAAYALFMASSGLPRHEEQALSRHINHRLKQMRL